MKLISTFLLLLAFNPLKSQTYSAEIKDSDIAYCIKKINTDVKLHAHKIDEQIISWHPGDFCDSNRINNITGDTSCYFSHYFTEEDIAYIKNQFEDIKASQQNWRRQDFREFVTIDSIGMHEIFLNSRKTARNHNRRKVKDNYSYSFSIPLFSLDKKSVVIKRRYYCGFLCATECVALYRLTADDKWALIKNWDCWAE